jgi:hypothetical protein
VKAAVSLWDVTGLADFQPGQGVLGPLEFQVPRLLLTAPSPGARRAPLPTASSGAGLVFQALAARRLAHG